MSDYLNNLLAKTLNLTEVIQPRLVSLFEPPNLLDRSVLGDSSAPEMEDEKPYAEKPSDDSSPTRPLERLPVKDPRESLVIPKLQRPLTDTESPSIRPLIHQEDQTTIPPLLAVKQSSIVAHPTVREAPHDVAPERPTPCATTAAPTHIVPPPDTAQEDRQPDLKPAIPRTEPPPDTAQPAIPRTELPPGQATRPSMLKMAVVQPQVLPYIEPKTQAAPEIIPTPKPAPSIHVTIGRVEVRAMTAPAAPVKAPRPSPAPSLTLNEYLQQRQEGRR